MTNWQPIATVTPEVKDGKHFLARWPRNPEVLGGWEVCVAQYGQFGNCFISAPIGYYAGVEVWEDEGKGNNGSGFSIGYPEILPTEWCEIPE